MIPLLINISIMSVFIFLTKENSLVPPHLYLITLLSYAFLFTLFLKNDFIKFKDKYINPFSISIFSFLIVICFQIVTKQIITIQSTILAGSIFFIPLILIYLIKREKGKGHFISWDILILICPTIMLLMKFAYIKIFSWNNLSINLLKPLLVVYLMGLYICYNKILIHKDDSFLSFIRKICTTIFLSIILILLIIVMNSFFHFLEYTSFEFNLSQFSIVALFSLCVISSSEEIYFRGFLMNYFVQMFSPFIGIILSSIIFGLTHFAFGYPMIILATIAGVFYGYVYHKTKNIYCAMFIHTFINLVWQLFFRIF